MLSGFLSLRLMHSVSSLENAWALSLFPFFSFSSVHWSPFFPFIELCKSRLNLLYPTSPFLFFFVSHSFFIPLICLNLPCSWMGASALCLSGLVSQREGKKEEEERLAKIKGLGHCLKQSVCWTSFIYCLLQCVFDGRWRAARDKQT